MYQWMVANLGHIAAPLALLVLAVMGVGLFLHSCRLLQRHSGTERPCPGEQLFQGDCDGRDDSVAQNQR